MNGVVAFILAGGVGKRLSLLTRFRAKPAVPFAGRYRIIDFTLTNCVRSGIDEIFVLTQYISRSLVRHIGIGKAWDLDRLKGGVHILHPHLGYQAANWYRGTADAIYQNISVLDGLDTGNVLILSGDHIYGMDYREFMDFHVKSGKPASVAVVSVPKPLCREFGIATLDSRGVIQRFDEKPEHSRSNLASMGIYIFDKEFLILKLKELSNEYDDLDFGKHMIPHLVRERMISAFRFSGYWLDIGTLNSYYRASLDLLKENSRLQLHGGDHPVLTVPDDYPPLVVTGSSKIDRSLICNGCVIGGEVISSILSPGVRVERGARIENSIILHDCTIRNGARVKNAIVDKMTVIGRGAKIGIGNPSIASRFQPNYLDIGVTLIGRKTRIPAGLCIGTNCLVCGSRSSGMTPRKDIEDGGYYIAEDVAFRPEP